MHNCTKRQQSCVAELGWPHSNEPTATAMNKSFALASLLPVSRCPCTAGPGARRMHRIGVTSIHAYASLLDHRWRRTQNRRVHLVSRSRRNTGTIVFFRAAGTGTRGDARARARINLRNQLDSAEPGRGAMEVTAPVGWETWHVQPPRHVHYLDAMPISQESAGSPLPMELAAA